MTKTFPGTSRALPDHDVSTVQGLGWSGVTNGELLERATDRFDALVTMDRNLEHQHEVRRFPFGVVVTRAASNRMAHLRPLIPALLQALDDLHSGTVRHVGRR